MGSWRTPLRRYRPNRKMTEVGATLREGSQPESRVFVGTRRIRHRQRPPPPRSMASFYWPMIVMSRAAGLPRSRHNSPLIRCRLDVISQAFSLSSATRFPALADGRTKYGARATRSQSLLTVESDPIVGEAIGKSVPLYGEALLLQYTI
jgi:hypothetical protein